MDNTEQWEKCNVIELREFDHSVTVKMIIANIEIYQGFQNIYSTQM